MGYSPEIYQAAEARLKERRNAAIALAERRKGQLYGRYPRLAEIEKELSATAHRVIKAVMNGENTEALVEEMRQKNLSLQMERCDLLQKAGFAPDYLEPQYHCKDCEDTGYQDGHRCRCLKRELRVQAAKALNLTSDLKPTSFGTFRLDYYSAQRDPKLGIVPRQKMEQIFHYCTHYAEDFGPHSPSLLFMGKTGLGKTHLSLAIAAAAIDKGYGALYLSWQNILGRLEDEQFGRVQEKRTLPLLCDCDLLILDDVGAEFITPFDTATLGSIITTRLAAGRPTIVSTNLTFGELEKTYSERIVSRLMGGYQNLQFVGEDIRLQGYRNK